MTKKNGRKIIKPLRYAVITESWGEVIEAEIGGIKFYSSKYVDRRLGDITSSICIINREIDIIKKWIISAFFLALLSVSICLVKALL